MKETFAQYLGNEARHLLQHSCSPQPVASFRTQSLQLHGSCVRASSFVPTRTFYKSSLRTTSLLWIALALLIPFATPGALGQVAPAARHATPISVFGTFTAGKRDFRYYGDLAIYGISAGGFMQAQHILGVDVRGSLLRSGGLEHEESVLGGPRAAMHFGRISPYVAVLGGATNARWWNNPPPNHLALKPQLDEGIGQWTALGGIDVYLRRHFSLRAGEFFGLEDMFEEPNCDSAERQRGRCVSTQLDMTRCRLGKQRRSAS